MRRGWLVVGLLLLSGCFSPNDSVEMHDAASALPGNLTTTQPGAARTPVVTEPATGETLSWIIEVGHGHIDVRASASNVTIQHIDGGPIRPAEWSNDFWRMGFLRAGETYRVSADGNVQTIQMAGGPQWSAEPLVRPGVWLANMGTMNFILQDATNETLYALTTGHGAGARDLPVGVMDSTGAYALYYDEERVTWFGTILDVGYEGVQDWALIKINEDQRHLVSPLVTHWTGPAGHDGGLTKGDTLCMFGRGQLWQLGGAAGLQPRCGGFDNYRSDDGGVYGLNMGMVASGGDSGSPVINYETGAAVGYAVSAGGTSTTVHSICSVLHNLQEAGHDLALSTAVYRPPPEQPGLPTSGLPGPGAPDLLPCDQWPPRTML